MHSGPGLVRALRAMARRSGRRAEQALHEHGIVPAAEPEGDALAEIAAELCGCGPGDVALCKPGQPILGQGHAGLAPLVAVVADRQPVVALTEVQAQVAANTVHVAKQPIERSGRVESRVGLRRHKGAIVALTHEAQSAAQQQRASSRPNA